MRRFLALTMFLAARGAARAESCSHAIVGREVAPNQAWQAVVDETTCGAGSYATDVTATVRVGPVAPSARVNAPGIAVLGVDTGGHAEDRPRLAWSGATVLDVTVPNLSYLKILQLHPGEVSVHLHFDPDDAAARRAWLAQHNLAPD